MSRERRSQDVVDSVLGVAIPSPLRSVFDYLPADACQLPPLGVRVRVPFGRRRVVGVVVAHRQGSALPASRLRKIDDVIDDEPVLDAALLRLLQFTSDYFQHPIGDVMSAMLPSALRKGSPAQPPVLRRFRITDTGRGVLQAGSLRGQRQRDVLNCLNLAPQGVDRQQLDASARVLDRLLALRCIEEFHVSAIDASDENRLPAAVVDRPQLNSEQAQAVQTVLDARSTFAALLLEGVTGSGKTEVYLRIIEQVVADGRQALILIPEIGLTPQTIRRFEQRLGVRVAAMHSSLSEGERFDAWLRARSAHASVVVGTRSAVFAPLPLPGVIIVDEEHDASFKQQDGVRYSARDLAVLRAREANVPVVLGSATPAMETLHNVSIGRYQRLRLAHRAGGAVAPQVAVLDLKGRPLDGGLCEPMFDAISECLARDEQAILFVNRRGYAPVMLCRECGAPVDCERCDAHLVLHRDDELLHCHHCGHQRPPPSTCACGETGTLRSVGLGTQRVMETLLRRFPAARIARVDRDSTRARGAMAALIEQVAGGELDVLVGTQMLAKGHDFPAVTLVGILDGDAGLFSTDFRAPERMAQLIIQVAGRAGRGSRPGKVLIQSHHPGNPLLRTLVQHGYAPFAENVLAERRAAGLPPFGHMALLRAEAVDARAAAAFLEAARDCAPSHQHVHVLGPIPSPMQRRAGKHRAQLLAESSARASLHSVLRLWLPRLSELPEARRVRWSVDVDPQDMA